MADWDDITSSGNIEDRRGLGAKTFVAGGTGLAAVLITLGLSFFGLSVPQTTVEEVLVQLQSFQSQTVQSNEQQVEFKGEDEYEVFVSKVLGSANDVWSKAFTVSGDEYVEPRLVLFRGYTQSECGIATSQIGPHYCPTDKTIYLDETFFLDLKSRLGASTGDVAQAYVITHEVGHHIQNQQGLFDDPTMMTQDGSIALELQADCYAGVWAFSQSKRGVFADNEISQALSAAAAVGDDNIQSVTEGRVNPETWTHGSSAQRVSSFKLGFSTGDPSRCAEVK